jgi:hypothetical protein
VLTLEERIQVRGRDEDVSVALLHELIISDREADAYGAPANPPTPNPPSIASTGDC